LKDNKKLFVIAGIIGVFATSVVIFFILQLNLNSEQSPRIETKTVNPEEVCIDIVDMGFSSEQECIYFVEEILTKIKDYSQSIDCKEHQLLFDKLGIECWLKSLNNSGKQFVSNVN